MKEDTAQLRSQLIGQNIEIPDFALDVFYSLAMGDLAVGFQSEFKIFGDFTQPAFENLRFGITVKGHVDLDCVEVLSIKGKPSFLGKPLWIESPLPARITPSRCAQVIDHKFSFSLSQESEKEDVSSEMLPSHIYNLTPYFFLCYK